MDSDTAEKDSLAEDDGLGIVKSRTESEAELQINIKQKQAVSCRPSKCRVGDTSGSPLMEVTKTGTKLQEGTCVNIQLEDKFPVSGPDIGQAVGWNASDMKAEHSGHCPSELTEPEKPAVANTHTVEERSVEIQSFRSFKDKREDNISEAEARTFLHLQSLDQLSPPIPDRCFQEQDGGCLIHLDKSSEVDGRTDKTKVTKAKVHPKSPVA